MATVTDVEGKEAGIDRLVWLDRYIDKKYDEALKEFNEAIKSYPDIKEEEGYWRTKINLKLSFATEVKVINKMIEDGSITKRELNAITSELFEMRLYKDCILYCDLGIKADKMHLSMYTRKANSLHSLGNQSEAEIFINNAIAQFPESVDLVLIKADWISKSGEKSLAIDCLESTKSIVGIKNEIQRKLVGWYYELADYNNVICNSRLALVNNENDTYFITMMGNACNELEMFSVALELYERANEIAKGNEAWILANIGNLYNNRNLHSGSFEYFTQALAKSPDDEYALSRLADARKLHSEENEKFSSK